MAGVGRTLVTLGIEATDRLHTPDALLWLREAVKVMRSVVSDYPSDAEYRGKQLAALWRLGSILRTDPAARTEAEQCLREAVSVADRLIAEAPKAVDPRHGRGIAKASLGDMAFPTNPAEAARYYDEATDDLEIVLKSDNRNVVSSWIMPIMLRKRCELADGAGDHAALAKAARRLQHHTESKTYGGVNSAKFLARAAALAAGDTKLAETKRKALAAEYGRDAVASLQVAVAAGFNNVERLRGDEFAPIRERDDFQKLLKGLEKK
jgi:hypothetical protein